ncbi:hypothetical protein FRC09_000256 [Ceratobasidium sp. 395]|nr:hypothetical protein FRC09_000256 [Ceratobasidium sp. 395]
MTETASVSELSSLANLGDTREKFAQRALQILKQIEQSGGSAAFENWLKETNNGADAYILPDFETGLQLNAQAGFLPSSVGAWSSDEYVPTAATTSDSGGAFDLGAGYLNFDADMVLHDARTFDSLRGSVSKFWFFAGTSMNGQPVGQIRFYDKDGNTSATVLAVIGFGIAAAVGFRGDFVLKKI